MFFEVLEELIGLPVARSDDFYFDDIVDEINTAVFPGTS